MEISSTLSSQQEMKGIFFLFNNKAIEMHNYFPKIFRKSQMSMEKKIAASSQVSLSFFWLEYLERIFRQC